MGYVVYQNIPRSRAVLHQLPCPFYRIRGGTHCKDLGRWDEFNDEESATAHWRASGKKIICRCAFCWRARKEP